MLLDIAPMLLFATVAYCCIWSRNSHVVLLVDVGRDVDEELLSHRCVRLLSTDHLLERVWCIEVII